MPVRCAQSPSRARALRGTWLIIVVSSCLPLFTFQWNEVNETVATVAVWIATAWWSFCCLRGSLRFEAKDLFTLLDSDGNGQLDSWDALECHQAVQLEACGTETETVDFVPCFARIRVLAGVTWTNARPHLLHAVFHRSWKHRALWKILEVPVQIISVARIVNFSLLWIEDLSLDMVWWVPEPVLQPESCLFSHCFWVPVGKSRLWILFEAFLLCSWTSSAKACKTMQFPWSERRSGAYFILCQWRNRVFQNLGLWVNGSSSVSGFKDDSLMDWSSWLV